MASCGPLEANADCIPLTSIELGLVPYDGMADFLAEMRNGFSCPQSHVSAVWVLAAIEQHEVEHLRMMVERTGQERYHRRHSPKCRTRADSAAWQHKRYASACCAISPGHPSMP